MPKVAISGYSGFLARNLEKKLRQYEYAVIGIPRTTLYDITQLEMFFSVNNPDFIIHTAAYGNKFNQQNDYETVFANIMTLVNMLETSRNVDYKGFINISSSSAGLPYETFYSATKVAGERIVRAFVNKYNKPALSVRPFTIIGKGEQQEHLIPQLIQSCQLQKEIPFVPNSVHDYISVSDFCDAILLIMEHTEELKSSIIDIGTGKGTTNQKVKEIVEKVTQKDAIVKEKESLRPYDSKHWSANPVIIKYLGWKQKETIEDVVKKMVYG